MQRSIPRYLPPNSMVSPLCKYPHIRYSSAEGPTNTPERLEELGHTPISMYIAHARYFPATYMPKSPLRQTKSLQFHRLPRLIYPRHRCHFNIIRRALQCPTNEHKRRRFRPQPLHLEELLGIEPPSIFQVLQFLPPFKSRTVVSLQGLKILVLYCHGCSTDGAAEDEDVAVRPR